MHFDSFMHISFCFRTSNTCRHTAWQVGRIGRIVAFSFFNDDTDAVHSFCPPSRSGVSKLSGWRRMGPGRSGRAYRRVRVAATPKGPEHVWVMRRQDPRYFFLYLKQSTTWSSTMPVA